jgi:hypothetical protein
MARQKKKDTNIHQYIKTTNKSSLPSKHESKYIKQELSDLNKSLGEANLKISSFSTYCFSYLISKFSY